MTAAIREPDYGYVSHGLKAVETNDFHLSSIQSVPPSNFDVLITYTRTWAPEDGLIASPLVRRFLTHFYQWAPEITREQCAELGLYPDVSWGMHGQTISIYRRR